MDEQLVLSALTLRLNPDLHRVEVAPGVVALKNIPARKYLTVSAQQWTVLRNFAHPATVPDVLRAAIVNRHCIALREYYELILKAQRAGILLADRQVTPEARDRRWPISLPPWLLIGLAVLSAAVAITLLLKNPFPWPGRSWPAALESVAIGWVLLIAGLSLGNILAASVLRYGGGECGWPVFRFLRFVPAFSVDLQDVSVTSRVTQAGVYCARLFPVLAIAGVLWFYRPEWGGLHVLALLILLRPVPGGALPQLLSALCRGHILDTHRNLIFSQNRRWRVRLKFGLARVSGFYVTMRVLWGLIWCALTMFVVFRALGLALQDVFSNGVYWREVGLVFTGTALLAILVYVAPPLLRSIYAYMSARFSLWRKAWRRWHPRGPETFSPEEIGRVLAGSLLLRRLSTVERAHLIKKGQVRRFKAWRLIHRFTEKPTEVGIVLSGRVGFYRRLKLGRADCVLNFIEGDIFGAQSLYDPERPQVQLRASTPVVALMLPLADFQELVVTQLGTTLVNDLAHKLPFLRALSFCNTWHPQAVGRFAQLASVVNYNPSQVIIAQRHDSQQFYVVYEGRVTVKRDRRRPARLRPGAYFGEISLLQNGTSVADVIAWDTVRCLVISRTEFLRFLTHNPIVALQIEEVSSERLGHPVFPLRGAAYETR